MKLKPRASGNAFLVVLPSSVLPAPEEHTHLLEDMPPRGLAPDRDASDVAKATGKSVLVILKPKSKGNAVTLG